MYYIKGILLMAVMALTLAGLVRLVVSHGAEPIPEMPGNVVYFEAALIPERVNIAGDNWWLEEHHLRCDTAFVRLAVVRSDTDAIVFAVYADSTAIKVGRYKSVGCWWMPGGWKQKVCPEK